jgi:alcohol dehydrogenase
MQAFRYAEMMAMIEQRKLLPERLLGALITLEDSLDALVKMDQFNSAGVTVINKF